MEALFGRFKQHTIICATRPSRIQAVVDGIKEYDLLVAYQQMILQLLGGTVVRSVCDGIVGVDYLAQKIDFFLSLP